MPGNDPKDLQPPIEYRIRRVARPLTEGEIKRAADRAEARAVQMSQTAEDQARSNPTNPDHGAGPGEPKSPSSGEILPFDLGSRILIF